MENFFNHWKEEAVRHYTSPTIVEAYHVIEDYIHFHNYECIQSKPKLTPHERTKVSVDLTSHALSFCVYFGAGRAPCLVLFSVTFVVSSSSALWFFAARA